METSIIQKIKRSAGKLIETQFLKTGSVLDVRRWEISGMVEIDLHLPAANMDEWDQVPYIKFQVDGFSFRDYTPFAWDAETSTCSILIDTNHNGQGSRWANALQTHDAVRYMKADSTRQSPHPTDFIVGLGDASALGHLLALQQLTVPKSRFDAAVILDDPMAGSLQNEYFNSPIHIHSSRHALSNWLKDQGYCTTHTWFYLNGNQQMVIEVRRLLKSLGHNNIRVKGFWS